MVLPNRVLTNGNGHYWGGTDAYRWQRETFQKTRQDDHLPPTSGGFLSTHLPNTPPSTTSPLSPPPSPSWSLVSPSTAPDAWSTWPPATLFSLTKHFFHLPPTESSFLLKSSPIPTSSGQRPLTFQTGDIPNRCSWSITGLGCRALTAGVITHLSDYLVDTASTHSVAYMSSGIRDVSSCATVIPAPTIIPSIQQYSVKINEGLWTDEYATAAVPGTVSQDMIGTQRGWRQPTVSQAVA